MSAAISTGNDTVKGTTTNAVLATSAFPQFPGPDPLAHAATQFIEVAEARLADRGLLAVAQGHLPPAVKCIVDIELLPELPTGHRDYERRLDSRSKAKAINQANAEKRSDLVLSAWTSVYTLLKESTEVSDPCFSRELKDLCDLSKTRGLPGGYYDGPRAWALVLDKLKGGRRTEADKKYYRAAERVQCDSTLPDGCPAADVQLRNGAKEQRPQGGHHRIRGLP